MSLGDQVLVLHGEDGQLDADHAPDLARPQAAGVDDVLGVHVALVGDHVPAAVAALLAVDDARLAHDLGAADLGRLRVGVRDAVRVDVALDRVVHRADEVLLLEQREQLLGLGDRDQLEVHAEVAAARLGHLQPVEALGRAGEHDAAGDVHAAGLAGDLLDLLVELDRVLLQLRDVRVAVDRVHAARRVPGRARGQLGALDQHHVLPARLGQVVEHARAHHATADHRHLHVRPHTDPRVTQRSKNPGPPRPRPRIVPSRGQLTGGAPPSALRRATKASSASTTAGSRAGAT